MDIRTDSISAVAVSLGIRENQVTACSHAPIDPKKDIETEWRAALKHISGQMKLSDAVSTVSIPAGRLYYRNVRIPFKEEKKVRQILPFHIESQLPVPVEELAIAFQPVPLSAQGTGTDLVTAAIEKRDLDRFLEILEAFHIKPRTVTVGGYAAARVLAAGAEATRQSIVVDMDTDTCTLFYLRSGRICFVRSFQINADPSDPAAAVAPAIQRSLLAWEETSDLHFQPETLFLTGPNPGANGFKTALSKALDLPVQHVDFSQQAGKIAPSLKKEAWRTVKTSNVLPLVLSEIARHSGFNFNREVFAGEKFWRENKPKLMKTGLLALLIGGLALLNFGLDVRAKQRILGQFNEQITQTFRSAFPEVKRIVDPLHQMRLKVKEARNEARSYGVSGNRPLAIDVLNEISRRIPRTLDVRLVRLALGPEGVLISGNSDTFNTVDDAKNLLEKSPFFTAISISSTSKDKSGKRVNFKLKIQL